MRRYFPARSEDEAVRQAAGEDLSTPEMDVFEFEEDEEAEDTEEGAEASEEAAEEEA